MTLRLGYGESKVLSFSVPMDEVEVEIEHVIRDGLKNRWVHEPHDGRGCRRCLEGHRSFQRYLLPVFCEDDFDLIYAPLGLFRVVRGRWEEEPKAFCSKKWRLTRCGVMSNPPYTLEVAS